MSKKAELNFTITKENKKQYLAKVKVNTTLYYDEDTGTMGDDKNTCFQWEYHPIIKRNTTLYLFENEDYNIDENEMKYVMELKNGISKMYFKNMIDALECDVDLLEITEKCKKLYFEEIYNQDFKEKQND